jgi:serine/threonine protein kinase
VGPTRSVDSPALARGEALAPGLDVIEHLARDETCDVYEISDARRGCKSVAKTPRPERVDDERARRWLRLEGRLLADITHPHVAHAYQTVEDPRAIVLLEAMPGLTLSRTLELCNRGLPVRQVAILGTQIGSALRHLHGRGLLHLSLGPSNVVVAPGVAWLFDLGLARTTERWRPRQPDRLAPEQGLDGPVGPATDVWGLGSLLFEAATGRPPLPRSFPSDLAQRDGRAPPARALRRLPRALAGVIDHCLEPDPSSRTGIDSVLEGLARVA